MNLTTVIGEVKAILFRKDDFLIGVLDTVDGEVKFTGNMYGIEQKDHITIIGKTVHHPRYGEQLQVERWERPLPSTREQVINFLSSGLIKGLGIKRAEVIADRLGNNAVEIIKNDGEKALEGIRGIGKATAKDIVEGIRETYEVQEIIGELAHFGVTADMAIKVYRKYEGETLDKVRKNPYILTEIDGVGFITVDSIARKMGILPTSSHRVNACIDYVLIRICNQRGHTFVKDHELIQETLMALNANVEPSQHVMAEEVRQSIYLLEDKKLVVENDNVYPMYLYQYETKLARKLAILLKNRGSRDGEAMPFSENKVDKHIKNYQKKNKIILANEQREAIKRLIEEDVLVLTGGPGTGKTTVVKGIIDVYKKTNKNAHIRLVAPTGRSSKKLEEATGFESMTIHRMIGYRQGEYPDYHNDNKLSGDLFIVDEMSMVDLQLAHYLLDAIENKAKVLFVGDVDQLPSVAPGNVLYDLIQSNVPTVRLTEIFRQAEESQIVTNAHRVNNGKTLLIDQEKEDFYFINRMNVHEIAQLIVMSVLRFEALGYSLEDILVLSPMRKGEVGTIILNEKLREALNPPSKAKKEVKFGNRTFRVGDKIMQNVNDNEKSVYNGELGIITNITKETREDDDKLVDVIVAKFDGRTIKYYRDEFNQIELGYALTIHKSQGGEAPIVIMPITMNHRIMLARNLYYTGITRAKEKVVLIGTNEAMNMAIQNNRIAERNSKLDTRIKEEVRKIEFYDEGKVERAE